ncbi:MAG: RHS repeat-associated core domain-containing protein [Bryobacteraceae bacterium]
MQWGNSYSYDGFGNLTAKVVTKGTAPQVYPQVNSATNQARVLYDNGFDANGNWLGTAAAPNTWNVENQLISNGSVDGSGNLLTYTYDPWGKRVMQFSTSPGAAGSGTLYFYSITGQRLGTYQLVWIAPWTLVMAGPQPMYFGKRLLAWEDRLGSVRANRSAQSFAYYPWGEERTSTPDGQEKFATYFRDVSTDGVGEDYANARYYNNNFGRFWNPDPLGIKTADPKNPTSWNMYAYAGGDPVNWRDPTGLFLSVLELGGDGGDDGGDFDICMLAPEYPGCGGTVGLPPGGGGVNPNGPGVPGLGVLKSVFLAPAVQGAGALLQNPDCASLFNVGAMESLFGTDDPSVILANAYADNKIRLEPFDSDISSGVMAETTGVDDLILIASNRAFVTGIMANGMSITQTQAFQGLTLSQVDEVILIHELLNFTDTAGDDDAGQSITLGNGDTVTGSAGITQEVIKNCIH